MRNCSVCFVDPLGMRARLLLGDTAEDKDGWERLAEKLSEYAENLEKKLKTRTGDSWTFYWDGEKVERGIFLQRLKRERLTVSTTPFETLAGDVADIQKAVDDHEVDYDFTVYNHHGQAIYGESEPPVEGVLPPVVDASVHFGDEYVKMDDVVAALSQVLVKIGKLHHAACYKDARQNRHRISFQITWPEKRGIDDLGCEAHYGAIQYREYVKKSIYDSPEVEE